MMLYYVYSTAVGASGDTLGAGVSGAVDVLLNAYVGAGFVITADVFF